MKGISSRTDKKQTTDNLRFNKYAITDMLLVFPPKIDIKYLRIHRSIWPSSLEGRTLFSEKYELKFYIKGDSEEKVNINAR